MPSVLYAYIVISMLFLLVARHMYVIFQPTLLVLFFAIAEMQQ